MSVNSKHNNDFDNFVREQIDKVNIDFNESHWNLLESQLNQPRLTGKVWGQTINYKLLFYLTLGVLMALVSSVIHYRISQQNRSSLIEDDPIHQTTETTIEEQIQPTGEVQILPLSSPDPMTHSNSNSTLPQLTEIEAQDNATDKVIAKETDSEKLPLKIVEDSLKEKRTKKKHIIW